MEKLSENVQRYRVSYLKTGPYLIERSTQRKKKNTFKLHFHQEAGGLFRLAGYR